MICIENQRMGEDLSEDEEFRVENKLFHKSNPLPFPQVIK